MNKYCRMRQVKYEGGWVGQRAASHSHERPPPARWSTPPPPTLTMIEWNSPATQLLAKLVSQLRLQLRNRLLGVAPIKSDRVFG
jgi:hypothetical protein